VIEVGLFILPCVKELVCTEVPEISTMYWTPAKSGVKIFCRRDGKTFCVFGLDTYEERSRVINFGHKRAWRKWLQRSLFRLCKERTAIRRWVPDVPAYRLYQVYRRTANNGFTDMRRIATGIRSEKCVVRRFRRCANVYLHKPRQYSIAYYTPRLYGIAC
jgi:hypothetical protein